jgi:hypothetical protein
MARYTNPPTPIHCCIKPGNLSTMNFDALIGDVSGLRHTFTPGK